MITHTVFFALKHTAGSPAEGRFLERALSLARIPCVRDLRCVEQVGRKNPYAWGLVMGFADEAAHQRYNAHPDHVRFVEQHWAHEVGQFVEIDYVART